MKITRSAGKAFNKLAVESLSVTDSRSFILSFSPTDCNRNTSDK